jgi:hypothetical protein
MHASNHANMERFNPVHTNCEEIGSDVAQALPAAHALTGYNQQLVLNVKEIGVSNKIMQVAKDIPALATFGTSVDLEERLPASRTYALSLYGNKKRSNGEPCVNLDQLRYEFACKTDKPAPAFPPTEYAFKQYVLRVKYQVAIWVHSDQAKPVLWSPAGNGWKMDDADLQPVLYEKDAAPVEVRDLTHDMNCDDADFNDAQV